MGRTNLREALKKEPTQEELRKAAQERRCPFCGSDTFNALVEAWREFWFVGDKNHPDKLVTDWGEIETKGRLIEAKRHELVQCNMCGRAIPDEVWKDWGLI